MHGGGCREEVVVLRGVNLASICWLLVFFFFFLVDCGCGLVGFDDLATDWVGDDLA